MHCAPVSPRHFVVFTAILAVHVGIMVTLTLRNSQPAATADEVPVSVRFIEQAVSPPRSLPPQVSLLPVAIHTAMPELPVVDVPVIAVPSERSITLPVNTALAAGQSAAQLVSAVDYLREPMPRYPAQSRRLREQGVVMLRVSIDEQGNASNIEIESSSGFERLDHAAREAIARAAFQPYRENGVARRAVVLIPIEFSLHRQSARIAASRDG